MGNIQQVRFHYYKRSWLKKWSNGQIASYNYKTKEYTKNASVRNSFTLDVYPQLHDIYHKIEDRLDESDSKISKVMNDIEASTGDALKVVLEENYNFIKRYMNLMVFRQPWRALLEGGGFDPLNNEIESVLHAIRLAGVFGLTSHYIGLEAKAKYMARLEYESYIVVVKTKGMLPIYNTPMINKHIKDIGKAYMMPCGPNLLVCLLKNPHENRDKKLKEKMLKAYLDVETDLYPVEEIYHTRTVLEDKQELLKDVKKSFTIPEYDGIQFTKVTTIY